MTIPWTSMTKHFPSERLTGGGVLLTLVLLALVTRLPMVPWDFVNVDEAAHLVGSQELAGPGRLYGTFVDNKPPFIYFFYALGGGSMLALRLLAIAFLWLPLSWLAGRTGLAGRGEVSRPDQVRVGGLYLLSSAGFVAADTHAVNTELVGLMPVALATWLFFHSRSAWALLGVGALVGLASLAKQPFLALLLPPALTLALPWPGLLASVARIWPLALGCVAPLVLTSALFARAGSHEDYLHWVWLFNWQHVSAPVSLTEALVRFAKMGLPLLGASGALWLLAFWPFRNASSRGSSADAAFRSASSNQRLFLLTAFIAALLPAFLGFRLFGHYFLPAHYFLVQLAAPAFLRAWSVQGGVRVLAGLAVLPGVVFSVLNPLLYAPDKGVAPVTSPVFRRVGSYVKDRACKGPIFVWGYAPQVYVFAERRPASRYVLPIEPITAFVSGNERFERGGLPPNFHVDEHRRAELLADLERTPPDYIVDFSSTELEYWNRFPPRTFPGLERLLAESYESLGTPVGGITVYERKSCSPASSGPRSR